MCRVQKNPPGKYSFAFGVFAITPTGEAISILWKIVFRKKKKKQKRKRVAFSVCFRSI